MPQKADMPRQRGEGAAGGKIGSFMSTPTEPALNTCSGPSPSAPFHGHLPDLRGRRGGLVAEKCLRKRINLTRPHP